MSSILSQNIGRQGMVATLDRAVPNAAGQRVMLRRAAGEISSLSTEGRHAGIWHAVVLGKPIQIDHLATREIMVADACLHPAMMNSGEAETSACESSGHRSINMQRAMRFVPVAWALKSLFAFWVEDRGWRGYYRTFKTDYGEFHLGAHVDAAGAWVLQCKTSTSGNAIVGERRLESVEFLGSVFLAVAQMWREALPDAPLPQLLSLASDYEHHLEQMRGLAVTLPALHADGETFRHLRQRILRRHGPPVGPQPKAVTMTNIGTLLNLTVDGITYACPLVDGSWAESCAVDLNSLATMAGHSLRGPSVPLALALQYVRVGGMPLPRLACLPL